MKMHKLRLRKKGLIILCLYFLLLACMLGVLINFWQTHFLLGTEIDGVQCSFLNVEQAIEKINLEKGEENISFGFVSGNKYSVTFKEIGVRIDETRVAQNFNQQHLNPKETRKYSLVGFVLADSEKLRTFLKQIPELQEENMTEPQNAYMVFDDAGFSIHEDVQGNVINFEEAMNLALEEIKNGGNHMMEIL